MLTTLKDIFRPTWTKLIFSLFIGPALTVGALFLVAGARHGPDIIQYATAPLLIPYAVIGWLHLWGSRGLSLLPVLAFFYWYLVFSVCAYLVSRVRR